MDCSPAVGSCSVGRLRTVHPVIDLGPRRASVQYVVAVALRCCEARVAAVKPNTRVNSRVGLQVERPKQQRLSDFFSRIQDGITSLA